MYLCCGLMLDLTEHFMSSFGGNPSTDTFYCGIFFICGRYMHQMAQVLWGTKYPLNDVDIHFVVGLYQLLDQLAKLVYLIKPRTNKLLFE